MPTQADLDWQNIVSRNAQKARRESNVNKKEGGIYDLSTNSYNPREEFPQTGKKGIQDDAIDFPTRERTVEEAESSSGSGLPEFPGNAPSINIKAPLVWDGNNSDARWLEGTTQSVSDPKSYVDVFGYDPTPSSDNFSLFRTEFLEVIICKDGLPVTGNIFFVEATP